MVAAARIGPETVTYVSIFTSTASPTNFLPNRMWSARRPANPSNNSFTPRHRIQGESVLGLYALTRSATVIAM
jgi:hypothetical protein